MPPVLDEIGEVGWLARLPRHRGPGVVIGIGDDAAAVRADGATLLVSADALVEGVHFRKAWLTPRQLGVRAFRVAASDLAAMGGRVAWVLLALECAPRTDVAFLDDLAGGFAGAARRAGATLVGGNLSAGHRLSVTAVVIGRPVSSPVGRGGGRPGDLLFVTGSLGGAALAVRVLAEGRRPPAGALRAFVSPPDRLRVGAELGRARLASAMIDLSDGLAGDLRHLCAASGTGARIEAPRLPVAAACRSLPAAERLELALAGGDDYELLFAVPPARAGRLKALGRRLGCRLTLIGQLLPAGEGIRIVDESGEDRALGGPGYDHFQRARRSGRPRRLRQAGTDAYDGRAYAPRAPARPARGGSPR